jgi:hypothetical protein
VPPVLAPALRAALATPGVQRGLVESGSLPRITTTSAALDAFLGGGLPRGGLTQLSGPRSSGRTALAHRIAAAVTRAGEVAAWIDLADALDARHADSAGVDLGRLLWIRPPTAGLALHAALQVLETVGFALVILDLDAASGRVPTTAAIWLKVTRAAARTRTAVILLAERPLDPLTTALAVETTAPRSTFIGLGGPAPAFDGIATQLRIRRDKLGPPRRGDLSLRAAIG